jgi:nucleotide-binding universal stress UspA family protein
MLRLLVLVDGSSYGDKAVTYAISRAAMWKEPVHVHILNVQLPLTGVNVKLFVSKDSLEAYYRDEGMAILDPSRRRLAEAGLAHDYHIGVGDPGDVGVEYAATLGCDEIVMGTHGRGFLAGAVLGSVAQRVAQRSAVPVVLVK